MATDELYKQNLEEFVFDENKIVTYKWLSKTLQVHVNVAKQMLYAFVEEQRNKKDNDKLCVTYAVVGVAQDKHGNKYNKIELVPEEHLEAAKLQLNPVTSCHMYSIQAAKLQDPNPLYTTDYMAFKEDIFNSNKYSSISYNKAMARNEDELQNLRNSVMPTQRAPAFKPEEAKSKKKAPGTKQQAGIAGMFSNAKPKSSKTESPSEGTKSNGKSESQSDAAKSKPQKGVLAFFANQAEKPKKKEVAESKEITEKLEPEKSRSAKQESKTSSRPNKSKTTNGRRKKNESDEDDSVPEKKRRRIKKQSWESSSDEEEEMEEERCPTPPREPSPVREPSPTPESPPQPPEFSSGATKPAKAENKVKGKRRKRVQKTKTYTNDEGYIVTDKVWESEYSDCSDDEAVEVTDVKMPSPAKVTQLAKAINNNKSDVEKKKPPPKSKGKAASNTKQMSMMKFFKKKD